MDAQCPQNSGKWFTAYMSDIANSFGIKHFVKNLDFCHVPAYSFSITRNIGAREAYQWVNYNRRVFSHSELQAGTWFIFLDADVQVSPEFFRYINGAVTLSGTSNSLSKIFFQADCVPGDGLGGVIAVKASDFFAVGGYDENTFIGYGMEDQDLKMSLIHNRGLTPVLLPKNTIVHLPHSDELRTRYCGGDTKTGNIERFNRKWAGMI